MSKEIVDTVVGKYHKFEVWKETSLLSSPKFFVKSSDGKKRSGTFDALNKAVDWATKQG